MKLAVLISGRGSNMATLIEACESRDYPAEIVLVLSDRAGAAGLAHATARGIATRVIDHEAFDERADFEADVSAAIEASGAELVCLAGFMRLLTDGFVERWRDRLINIHPSLLPAFKGLNTHQRALDAGARFAGCTVHFVRAQMDEGPIIIQAAVPVRGDDTAESLAERVLVMEHRCYPLAVRWMAEGRVRVTGATVRIEGAENPAPALINPVGAGAR